MLRGLACRLRGGHDDAVVALGVVGGVGVARLRCDRCARRVLVPNRATTPAGMAERGALIDVAMVDGASLRALQLSAEVDS
jgi:hypothetical protein